MTFFIWSQLALVCFLGAISPGPSIAIIIRNSITHNRMSGIFTSIGHGLGIGFYASIVVFGLIFVLHSYAYLFIIIQIIGLVFLFFLGLFFIFTNNHNTSFEQKTVQTHSFVQGFIVAVVNPKIMVWFMALFSQFIRTEANTSEKIILICTPAFIDAIWYTIISIVVTGYGLKNFFEKRKLLIQKIIGVLLIFISIILLYKLISY